MPPRSTAPASGRAPTSCTRRKPRAPQLENTGVWRAKPILVSGASAYRDGEFLYQDFLYDDHGPRGRRDPGDPRLNTSEVAAAPNGTYTYPTDPVYAGNAADIVELRVKPLRSRDCLPAHAQHADRPRAGGLHDRARRRPGHFAPAPARRRRERARGPLPDGARRHGRAGGRRNRRRRGHAAREGRPAPPPVHDAGVARGLGSGPRDRAPRRGRGPLGRRAGPLPDSGRGGHRRRAGRRGRPRDPDRDLQRRVPVQRDLPGAGLHDLHRPRLVARPPAGTVPERQGDLGPVRGTGRLRQARLAGERRHAGAADRRAAGRADRPHPRQPFRDQAGPRLLDRVPGGRGGRRQHAAGLLQGRDARAAAALRGLCAAQAACRPPATA